MAKKSQNPRLNGFSTSFILRSSYVLKNEEYPIVLKITYLGDRKEINTGLSCLAQEWLAGKGMLNPMLKKASTINKELINVQIRFEELFMKMKQDLGDFTLDELIERAKGKATPPQTIQEYLKLHLDDLKSRVGVDIAQTTYYKYRRTANYFSEYLAKKKSTNHLPVSRIDEALLEDFFLFLRKDKKNAHNSSVALMNCLRTILDKPVKDGVIRVNPFLSVELTRKPVIRDYLTMEDIQALQNLSGLSEAMERNRHLFFDLDHTLWDFDANAMETLAELYDQMQLEAKGVSSFDDFSRHYLHHNAILWDRYHHGYITAEDLKWKRMWRTLLEFKIGDEVLAKHLSEQFLNILPTKQNLFPYTREILVYLKGKNYIIHLITNGFEKTQKRKIEHAQIAHYFDAMITSEKSNSVKPQKEIFEYALNATGASLHESIMIGDNPDADIQGAINAGMDSVYVNHLNKSIDILPTYTIYHLRELEEIL